jgi:nitrate reductase gamma subunit
MDREGRGRRIWSAWRSRVFLQRTVAERSRFGDAVIVLFLLAQAADGVMTYVGVTTFGAHLEANPLLASLMTVFGQGTAVTAAKLVASGLGISLHLVGVHRVLAVLTGIYFVAAVLPWAGLLLAL